MECKIPKKDTDIEQKFNLKNNYQIVDPSNNSNPSHHQETDCIKKLILKIMKRDFI